MLDGKNSAYKELDKYKIIKINSLNYYLFEIDNQIKFVSKLKLISKFKHITFECVDKKKNIIFFPAIKSYIIEKVKIYSSIDYIENKENLSNIFNLWNIYKIPLPKKYKFKNIQDICKSKKFQTTMKNYCEKLL